MKIAPSTIMDLVAKHTRSRERSRSHVVAAPAPVPAPSESGPGDKPEDPQPIPSSIPDHARRYPSMLRSVLGPGKIGYSDLHEPVIWIEVTHIVDFDTLMVLNKRFKLDGAVLTLGPGARPNTMRVRVSIGDKPSGPK